ncbi:MAG: ChaN family lipoprotein [Pseudomonas marincola]
MKKQALIISALALGVLSGCVSQQANDTADFYDTAENSGLTKRVTAADYVLLGEKHDNPQHHIIQEKILKNTLNAGDVVVFEMINSDQQPVMDQYLSGALPHDELEEALNWSKSGWPDWTFYAPLFEAAKNAKAIIKYGSFPRKQLMNMDEDRTVLADLLSADQLLKLDETIELSHCNMLPDNMVRPMSLLQIKKDKLLAQQMLTRGDTKRAYLVAGNGHIRKDRAVPIHLKADNIFVLSLAEELSEPDQWDLYSAYDAVWITESLGKTQEDYCKDLEKRFKKS